VIPKTVAWNLSGSKYALTILPILSKHLESEGINARLV
jgi:hypothetical protein